MTMQKLIEKIEALKRPWSMSDYNALIFAIFNSGLDAALDIIREHEAAQQPVNIEADDQPDSPLSRRIDKYINSENPCPIAIGLLSEQRKHLSATNRGAETNMNVAMNFLKRNPTPVAVSIEAGARAIAKLVYREGGLGKSGKYEGEDGYAETEWQWYKSDAKATAEAWGLSHDGKDSE